MEEKTKILIIGTGLTNSILAGALSRNINYDVSQIDCQKCYGGDEFPMKTFSELLEMPSSSIQIHLNDFDDLKYKNEIESRHEPLSEEIIKKLENNSDLSKKKFLNYFLSKFSKRHQIELNPKVLYSSGPLVDLIVKSGVGEGILEFQLVKNLFHSKIFQNDTSEVVGGCEKVPGNKEDVFSNENISLKDKRSIMKFFSGCIQSNNSSKDEDQSFVDFLAQHKISPHLQDIISKCLTFTLKGAEIQSLSKLKGVEKVGLYLKSIGRFGSGALLTAMYGSGSELCQAFTRYGAVYGVTTALECQILDIFRSKQKEYHISTNIETFKADTLIISADQLRYLPLLLKETCYPNFAEIEQNFFHLLIFSESQSLLQSNEHLIHFFADSQNGVYCIQLTSDSGMCPAGFCKKYYFL